MHEREAFRYRVSGRVQGVGFRWYVREAARALELSGWVRNTADGGVLVEASGSAAALFSLEAQLRAGPPGSRVDDVEVEPMGTAVWDLPTPFAVHR